MQLFWGRWRFLGLPSGPKSYSGIIPSIIDRRMLVKFHFHYSYWFCSGEKPINLKLENEQNWANESNRAIWSNFNWLVILGNLIKLQLMGQIGLSVQTSTDWSNWTICSDFNWLVKLGNLIRLQLMGQIGQSDQTSTDGSTWTICSDFNWLVKLGYLFRLQLIGQIGQSDQALTDGSTWAIWSDFNLWVKLGNLINNANMALLFNYTFKLLYIL